MPLPPPPNRPTPRQMLLRGALAGLAGAALLGVFWLYTRPDFLFTLANQVWACF